jgi:hypothetical protein
MPMLDFALKYISKGLSVIPISPVEGKKSPLLSEWKQFQQRLPTEDEVTSWFRQWPDAKIAVICGEVSGGMAVLDIDDLPTARRLLENKENLPTLTVGTPSSGLHLYLKTVGGAGKSTFLSSGEKPIGEFRTGKERALYVVAPPSPGYTIVVNKPMLSISDPNEWVKVFLRSYGVEITETGGSAENRKAYENLRERDLKDGERNSTLASEAGRMWNEGWAADRIMMSLKSLNQQFCKPPMEDSDVEIIVQSISSYPRTKTITDDPNDLSPVFVGQLAKPKPKPFLVDDYVPEGYVTMLYGEGAQGKSYLALYLATCISIGEPFLLKGCRQTNVLYLDWETDQDDFANRAYRIAAGMGMARPPTDTLMYMRLERPLGMILPALKKLLERSRVGLVVIDSLTMAGVRDVNSVEKVTDFFEQLRSMKTTVLALDHQPKPQKDDMGYSHKRPLGTVMKENLSRSVIQVQRTGWKPGQLDIKLQQTKSTFWSMTADTNFSILFEGDKITFLPYVYATS